MRRIIGAVLLLAALVQLSYRGYKRAEKDLPAWDFASVYAASKTWMHHGNPYDTAQVVQTWHHSGFFQNRDVSYFATVYPPSSLVMLTPFAMLPAGVATGLWMLLTVVLLAFQFAALIEMAELNKPDGSHLLLIGGTLATGALQFGLLSGQLSIPAISLCIIAFARAEDGKGTLSGLLLGLAFALKPQIAGPFLAYYLVMRRWQLVGVAALVGGIVWVIAIIAMHVTHVDWLAGWMGSMAATQKVGEVNDYGWTNHFRDEIVDLKMVLVNFLHDPHTLKLAVAGCVLAGLAWFVIFFPRGRRSRRAELLVLAALSALSLLPIYHRVYDVALLSMALAWALAELDGPRRAYAMAMLATMCVFLVPFDSVNKSLASHLHLGPVGNKAWWQSFVVPHYAWALAATTVVLLLSLRTERRRRA